MTATLSTEEIKKNLVVKSVHVVKRCGVKEADTESMYRPDVKLDLQRSRYLTESYRATEGQPMVLRRARSLENILTWTFIFETGKRLSAIPRQRPKGCFSAST